MRISGTKRVFADAFLSIVETKPIDRITVQDLLDACGAARQTFYNHFQDKNDLICWIFTSDMERIFQSHPASNDMVSCYHYMYRTFIEHKAFYTKAIRLEGQNNLSQTVFEYTLAYFTQHVQTHYGVAALDDAVRFAIDFNCYGAVNICREWMLNGMQRPADEMAVLLLRCMPQELKRFFPNIEKL